MNQQIQAEEEHNRAARVETEVVERDQLVRWGFSTEEIVALFWLNRWCQTDGSDHAPLGVSQAAGQSWKCNTEIP